MEYDNRGIARVLFHGFGAIPRVLVSSEAYNDARLGSPHVQLGDMRRPD